MSVKIRLSRHGAKKRPYYRIVVADIRASRDGKFIEKVGTFDPLKDKSDDSRLNLEIERIKQLDLDDKTKQNICNGELRKVLIKNKVTPSYKIVEWLSERREEYLDRLAYFQRENEWKKKKKLTSNTD